MSLLQMRPRKGLPDYSHGSRHRDIRSAADLPMGVDSGKKCQMSNNPTNLIEVTEMAGKSFLFVLHGPTEVLLPPL